MPRALETFHHALGTVVCGDDLSADHPIVKAAPHLFTPVEVVETPKPKRAKG